MLKKETRDKLKAVSTPTVATALFKRGFRTQAIQDVHPLSPMQESMVGEAFTLRYIPAREDLNQLTVFRDRGHPQRKAIEDCPPGQVMVMDSRMSGTSYGACILHVSPESYIGGPLALVKTGDMISLDVDKRTINMNVSDAELARRKAAWKKPEPRYERGYGWMFTRHIKQADEGCDFDFLETGFGAPVAEPSIY